MNYKKSIYIVLLYVLLSSCAVPASPTVEAIPTENAPTATWTPKPTYTFTPEPTSTDTPEPTVTDTPKPTDTPTATPLPGSVLIPLEEMANSIPWLPLDESKRPTSAMFIFNNNAEPFDNKYVRMAFAAAVDRKVIAEMAEEFYFKDVFPATTLTPPPTLGRELYGNIGISFNPELAKEWLAQGGYSDPSDFPEVTLFTSTRGEAAPGAWSRIADATTAMWQEHLGVTVKVKVIGDFGQYWRVILPEETPQIYQWTWGADVNDPDNFLYGLFYSGADWNFGQFISPDYDQLVTKAQSIGDPYERQILYLEAEYILTQELVGIIPLFHSNFYPGR